MGKVDKVNRENLPNNHVQQRCRGYRRVAEKGQIAAVWIFPGVHDGAHRSA